MKLAGIVTNVTNFGAFVDIGVHQDGLIHISELSDKFVKNPADVVSVNQKVMVTVMSVDTQRRRISLSMKSDADSRCKPKQEDKCRIGIYTLSAAKTAACIQGLRPMSNADLRNIKAVTARNTSVAGDRYPELQKKVGSRNMALMVEHRIKQLPKSQKEKLIRDDSRIDEIISSYLDKDE